MNKQKERNLPTYTVRYDTIRLSFLSPFYVYIRILFIFFILVRLGWGRGGKLIVMNIYIIR